MAALALQQSKAMRYLLLIALLTALPLGMWGQVLTPEQHFIPGRYEYLHSWDYAAPDGNGTIHCDETGTLDFYPDGTFSDTALQRQVLRMSTPIKTVWNSEATDTVSLSTFPFDFNYYCQGRWRVENGKFMFCELAEEFDMKLLNEKTNGWIIEYADMIEQKTLPNSSRWFTFDIELLDEVWFIWTYTYLNGRKDSWEMKRTKRY